MLHHPCILGGPQQREQNQNSKPPLRVTMMPLRAPSISKYGSLVRPDAQIDALRAHCARYPTLNARYEICSGKQMGRKMLNMSLAHLKSSARSENIVYKHVVKTKIQPLRNTKQNIHRPAPTTPVVQCNHFGVRRGGGRGLAIGQGQTGTTGQPHPRILGAPKEGGIAT